MDARTEAIQAWIPLSFGSIVAVLTTARGSRWRGDDKHEHTKQDASVT